MILSPIIEVFLRFLFSASAIHGTSVWSSSVSFVLRAGVPHVGRSPKYIPWEWKKHQAMVQCVGRH